MIDGIWIYGNTVIRQTVNIIALFLIGCCALFATPMSNISVGNQLTLGSHSTNFITTIVQIYQDPFTGYWLKCRTGETFVLIWEDDVRDLRIGNKYEVLCTYHGEMNYPSGEVSVYFGLVWEEVDGR